MPGKNAKKRAKLAAALKKKRREDPKWLSAKRVKEGKDAEKKAHTDHQILVDELWGDA